MVYLTLKFKKMKLTHKLLLALFAVLFLTMTSCKDDDPIVDPPEEVITDLVYTLSPLSGDPVTLSFSDPDGDGGNAPTISGGTLSANTTYTGSIVLTNASETPAEDITAEIQEEDEEHQFFFSASSGLNATVAYGDQDADGNPVGLSSTVTTGDASSGTMTVTLRHEPNKNGTDVASGDITNAGGETDIEVTFDITIQ